MMRNLAMTGLLMCALLAGLGVIGCSDGASESGFEGTESTGDAEGSGFEWNDTLSLPGGTDLSDVDLGGGHFGRCLLTTPISD